MPNESPKLRILICHNSYQQAGGEDTVVAMESQLLSEHGHHVQLHQVFNKSINSLQEKVRTGLNISYSKQAKMQLTKTLTEFKPHIVHCHNLFPLLTPSLYDACIELSIPVIQTLHNFRNICPNALLLRNDQPCELCIKGSPYNATRYRCYRDSYLQSLAVSNMVAHHRKKGTWQNKVDRFIVLTEFSRSKFLAANFPLHRMSVKPNFINDPKTTDSLTPQDFVLYVGRLSTEKGLNILCQAFHKLNIPLKIAGEGPLKSEIEQTAASNIEVLGQQNQQQIYQLMSQAKYLIMPSLCYEGFPLVLVEAFALGLPVICSKLGGMAEIVKDQVHGLHFLPDNIDDLAKKAQWLYDNPQQCQLMGNNARQTYLDEYIPEKNYQQLINIYQEAIDEKTL